jgi:hypothetical protein
MISANKRAFVCALHKHRATTTTILLSLHFSLTLAAQRSCRLPSACYLPPRFLLPYRSCLTPLTLFRPLPSPVVHVMVLHCVEGGAAPPPGHQQRGESLKCRDEGGHLIPRMARCSTQQVVTASARGM